MVLQLGIRVVLLECLVLLSVMQLWQKGLLLLLLVPAVRFMQKMVLVLVELLLLQQNILAASLSVPIVLQQLPIRYPSVQAQLQPSMERK